MEKDGFRGVQSPSGDRGVGGTPGVVQRVPVLVPSPGLRPGVELNPDATVTFDAVKKFRGVGQVACLRLPQGRSRGVGPLLPVVPTHYDVIVQVVESILVLPLPRG